MTPEQRAAAVLGSIPLGKGDDYWIGAIGAEIRKAEDAAYKRGVEEAAKICDLEAPGNNGRLMAKKIRSLKSSGPGER